MGLVPNRFSMMLNLLLFSTSSAPDELHAGIGAERLFLSLGHGLEHSPVSAFQRLFRYFGRDGPALGGASFGPVRG